MNDIHDTPSEMPDRIEDIRRCANCDSVIEDNASLCPVCGAPILLAQKQAEKIGVEEQTDEDRKATAEAGSESFPGDPGIYIESPLREKRSPLTSILLIGMVVLFGAAALWILQNPGSISLALIPTPTGIAPTQTATPTWTPLPEETLPPTGTATETPIPRPTDTPQPPRLHQVVRDETLFSISLRYGVALNSIAEANEIASDSGLQVSQQLVIPWPTATPPLERVAVEVNGETIVADPADCRMYEIKGGDTFFGISAHERVPLEALMAVNRLTEQSILQPGDLICLPELIRGGVLPPTPGPSPFPTSTEPPPGPQLLYPVREALVDPPEGQLFLQWAAVKELNEDEWYMIEVTDLSAVDSYPNRGFTRQNSFQIPSSWRPIIPEEHRYRWRVQIIRVTGERDDGSFIYTFGGNSSDDALFNWLGAIPTPTRIPTSTPQPYQ